MCTRLLVIFIQASRLSHFCTRIRRFNFNGMNGHWGNHRLRVCTTASAPVSSTRIRVIPVRSRNQQPRGLPRNTCTCSCGSERARAGIWPSRPFPFCPTNVPPPPPPPLWMRQSCFQFFFSLHNASVYMVQNEWRVEAKRNAPDPWKTTRLSTAVRDLPTSSSAEPQAPMLL
jgi:hypothetical protein